MRARGSGVVGVNHHTPNRGSGGAWSAVRGHLVQGADEVPDDAVVDESAGGHGGIDLVGRVEHAVAVEVAGGQGRRVSTWRGDLVNLPAAPVEPRVAGRGRGHAALCAEEVVDGVP